MPAPVQAPTPTSGALSGNAGVCDVDQEMKTLRTAISAINKLRPRFVVVTGSFTHAYPLTTSPSSSTIPSSATPTASIPALASATPSSTTIPTPAPPSSTPVPPPSATQVNTQAAETLRDLQLNQFMRTMARVSETIPLLFVPGDRDVGEISITVQLIECLFLFFLLLSFRLNFSQVFCTFHSFFLRFLCTLHSPYFSLFLSIYSFL